MNWLALFLVFPVFGDTAIFFGNGTSAVVYREKDGQGGDWVYFRKCTGNLTGVDRHCPSSDSQSYAVEFSVYLANLSSAKGIPEEYRGHEGIEKASYQMDRITDWLVNHPASPSRAKALEERALYQSYQEKMWRLQNEVLAFLESGKERSVHTSYDKAEYEEVYHPLFVQIVIPSHAGGTSKVVRFVERAHKETDADRDKVLKLCPSPWTLLDTNTALGLTGKLPLAPGELVWLHWGRGPALFKVEGPEKVLSSAGFGGTGAVFCLGE